MLKETIIKSRKQQGFTQRSLAEAVGVRTATISDFERGKTNLGSDVLEKILIHLQIDLIQTALKKP